MKIVLINPSRHYYKESIGLDYILKRSIFPIGLLCLASVLRKHGHEVFLLDCLNDPETAVSRVKPKEIQYGLPNKKIIEKIKKINPEIIGISINFTSQSPFAFKLVRILKKYFPKIKIILGGCHSTVAWREILKEYKEVDFIILGEAEESFPRLIEALTYDKKIENISGLAYRRNGKIFQSSPLLIKNLNTLPLPAYDLVNFDDYFKRRERLLEEYEKISFENILIKIGKKILLDDSFKRRWDVSVITSRGCPFNCVFCSIHLQFGRVWRANSVDYVIKHLKLLINKYKINFIHFEDDNLSFNIKRFEDILDQIIEEKLQFNWDTPNGIRADFLTEPIIRKMKKSGCVEVTVAVESGSQEVLDKVINKALDLQKVEKTLKICQEYHLSTSAFYILGLPGETRKTMEETVKLTHYFEKKYSTKPTCSIAIPLPGTRLNQICQENDYFALSPTPTNLNKVGYFTNQALIRTKDFSTRDVIFFRRKLLRMENIFTLALYHLKNYFKKKQF